MPYENLDPSLALAFICKTEKELSDLWRLLKEVSSIYIVLYFTLIIM